MASDATGNSPLSDKTDAKEAKPLEYPSTDKGEVSCRVFSFFMDAHKSGLLSIDALIEGLGVPLDHFQNPAKRVTWDVWMELCDRFAAAYASDTDIIAIGADMSRNSAALSVLSPLARTTLSMEVIYKHGIRLRSPHLFPGVRFETKKAGQDLIIKVDVPKHRRAARNWLLTVAGGLIATPSVVSLPDAVLKDHTVTSHSLEIRIRPPNQRTIAARIGRSWRTLTGKEDALRKLELKHVDLNSMIERLERDRFELHVAMDALPNGIAIVRHGELVFVNPAFEVSFGTLDGRPLLARFHPDDRDHIKAVMAGDKVDSRDVRSLDGSTLHQLQWIAQVAGTNDRSMLLTRNVTAQRAAEAEAQKQRDTVNALTSALPDMVLRLDENGVLLDHLPGTFEGAERLTPLFGMDIFSIARQFPSYLDETLDKNLASIRATLEHRVETRSEIRVTTSSQIKWLEVRAVPASGSECLLLVRDMTAMRKLEEQLAISERLASIGSLAAGAAHEINNPLTYMMMNLTLAREALQDREDLRDAHESIVDAAHGTTRIARIILDLQSLSRKEQPKLEPLDLSATIKRAIRLSTQATGVPIEHSLAPDTFVMADPNLLVQAIVNLLNNAAQAICDGENIAVKTHRSDDHTALISIKDNGCGMTEAVKNRAFDPFFTTKHGTGTGLGLPIVRHIAAQLQGSMEIISAPDKGTEVIFQLPLTEAPITASQAVLNPSSTPVAPGSVLVVDDDDRVRKAMVKMLERHTVSAASSAKEAMDLLRSGLTVDLILCDIIMPEQSGITFFNEATALDPDLHPKFVFITGGTPNDDAREALRGLDRPHLRKPIEQHALVAQIEATLQSLRRPQKPK